MILFVRKKNNFKSLRELLSGIDFFVKSHNISTCIFSVQIFLK
jgi:hypothetical protein